MKKYLVILLKTLLILSLLTSCADTGSKPPLNNDQNQNTVGSASEWKPEIAETDTSVNEEAKQTSDDATTSSALLDVPSSNGELAAAYIKTLCSDTCYMKYRTVTDFYDTQTITLMETALQGDDIAIMATTDGITSLTVFKENDTYIVDHENHQVTIMSGGLASLYESTLPKSGYEFISSGVGELFGVSHIYEKFSSARGDVCFFFDEDNLKGIESNIGGLPTQWEILEINSTIPSQMFIIPENYDISYINILF